MSNKEKFGEELIKEEIYKAIREIEELLLTLIELKEDDLNMDFETTAASLGLGEFQFLKMYLESLMSPKSGNTLVREAAN
ncbi:hypothetical protein [Desulfosporosinus sp. FKA]|uniref:hypothetical protein n=1 Tax=Desulfosporosinus sp. FKA TaxID=1969834 RepID=UPI000B4A1BA0|nr:hypothetical protein [Desulfosporosinus sp. FKA]